LVLIFVLAMICTPVNQSAVSDADSLDEINVLLLVSTGFGGNYFDINETFIEWGAQVDTVAYTLNHEVESCARLSTNITADYLVSEMTEEILSGYDCIILPGGFSYGDYLRPGAIARFSPIMTSVERFAAEGKLMAKVKLADGHLQDLGPTN